jgi:hypothetical protein
LQYIGKNDFIDFFNSCLPAFHDKRYIREEGKLLFSIYKPYDSPLIPEFLQLWRNLADVNSLGGFHFNAINAKKDALDLGFDSYTSGTPRLNPGNNLLNKITKQAFNFRFSDMLRNFPHMGPEIYNYKDVVAAFLNTPVDDNEIPVVLTNWDNTPRSGRAGIVLKNASAEYFDLYLKPKFFQIDFYKVLE